MPLFLAKLKLFIKKTISIVSVSLIQFISKAKKAFSLQTFKRSNVFALRKKEFYFSKKLFWKRVFIAVFHNINRNKFISIITIFILSLIVLVFNVTLAVNYVANKTIEQISEKIDIIVWIDEQADQFQIEALKNDLERLPEVKKIIYTSKETALQNFQKENPEIHSFLNQYKLNNPLPASIGIISNHIENNLKIMNILQGDLYKYTIDQEKIKNNSEDKKRTEKLINITRFIYRSGNYLITLFLIVVIFISLNTINMLINRRSKEIQIMRLVGAKYSFIRLPFILEGIIYAIFAFVLGLVLIYGFVYKFQQELSNILSDDILLQGFQNTVGLFIQHFNSILFYEIIVAVIIGIISSYLAIELYLRKQNLLNQ